MKESLGSRGWILAILPRGVAVGAAMATALFAGFVLVRSQTTLGPGGTAVVLATAIVAFGIGNWAGAEKGEEGRPVKVRERWVSAAAPTAAAGAYASFSLIYQQVYPGPYWSMASLVLAVAIPAYAIGLVPPTLVAWQSASAEDDPPLEQGAAVGLLGIGMLAGAALGLLITGLIALPALSTGSVLMLAAAFLLAPLLLHDPAIGQPAETTIFETVSPFGVLRVSEVVFAEARQPERRLYLNDEEESGELVRSGAPTLAYIAAAESILAATTGPGASYLFLGGGAYTLPRRMAERDATATITVVELDPEVTRIAYRYFGVASHHRIGSVHGDARAFLQAADEPRYDRIYLDVYSGQEVLPYSLVTVEAAATIRDRLNSGGILAMNVIGVLDGDESRQPWSIVSTFSEVFTTVVVYTHFGPDFPDRQNLLLVATLDPAREFPPSAGTFDRWPESDWSSAEGLITFRDLLSTHEDNQIAQRARSAAAHGTV